MPAIPAAMPDTSPLPSTFATDGLPVLHAPPGAASVNAVVSPTQTTAVPEIVPALGNALTVTAWVAAAVPQLLLTV